MSSPTVTVLQNVPQASLGQLSNRIRGSQYANGILTAEALDAIDSVLGQFGEELGTPATISGLVIPQSLVLRQVLVAAMTITITTAPPSGEGDSLTVYVKADGPTGVLAWDAGVFQFASTEFDSTATRYTVFNFKGTDLAGELASLKWVMCTLPLAGL